MLQTRLAAEEDAGVLRRLFFANDTALIGLPDEIRLPLLEMQYAAREQSYAAEFPDAVNSVLLWDGEPIGRHLVTRSAAGFRGVDLAVLPEFQGRGIGSWALRRVQDEAGAIGGEFRLRVVKTNRALRLYLRLGFEITGEDELSYELMWNAGASEAQTLIRKAETL